MMGNPNELPLFAIPAVVVPPSRVCVSFQWPDDPDHLAILVALVQTLARWNFWDRDDAHNGKRLADLYKEVASSMQIGCDLFQVRQDPANPCLLDYSTDGGVTWIQFADISLCIQETFPTGSPPGYTQPGHQPGGGGITPASCQQVNITVPGGSSVIIPFNIAPGYTVEIDNPQGLFADFVAFPVLGIWYCYDGSHFAAGNCGSLSSPQSGDPLPTAPHMALLLAMPNGTFHALTAGTPFTIPNGMPAGNYTLLSNNISGAGFGGSVSMTVKVCRSATPPLACTSYDLTANSGPFVPLPCGTPLPAGAGTRFVALCASGEPAGTYLPGSGWEGSCYTDGAARPFGTWIVGHLATPAHLTNFACHVHITSAGGGAELPNLWIITKDATSGVWSNTPLSAEQPGPDHDYSYPIDIPNVSDLCIFQWEDFDYCSGTSGPGPIFITSVSLNCS